MSNEAYCRYRILLVRSDTAVCAYRSDIFKLMLAQNGIFSTLVGVLRPQESHSLTFFGVTKHVTSVGTESGVSSNNYHSVNTERMLRHGQKLRALQNVKVDLGLWASYRLTSYKPGV